MVCAVSVLACAWQQISQPCTGRCSTQSRTCKGSTHPSRQSRVGSRVLHVAVAAAAALSLWFGIRAVAQSEAVDEQQAVLAQFQSGTLDELLALVDERCATAGLDPDLARAMRGFLENRFRGGFDGYWYSQVAIGTPVLSDEEHTEAALAPFFRNLTARELPVGLSEQARVATFVDAVESHVSGQNRVTAFIVDPQAVFVAQSTVMGDPVADQVCFQTAGIDAKAWQGDATLCGRRWFGRCTLESARDTGRGVDGGNALESGHLGIIAVYADGTRAPIQLRFLHAPHCFSGESEWFVDRASRHGPSGDYSSFDF